MGSHQFPSIPQPSVCAEGGVNHGCGFVLLATQVRCLHCHGRPGARTAPLGALCPRRGLTGTALKATQSCPQTSLGFFTVKQHLI